MKPYVVFLAIALYSFVFISESAGQNLSVETLLDKAVSLSQKGDKTGVASALTESVSALESEAKSSGGELSTKLLSKVGDLKSMIPLASAGKLQTGVLGKAVNAVKMLIGANRISSLLGKGDSGLLGKAASVSNSLGLIKTGASILGAESQGKLSGLVNEASKTVSGLDKSGPAGKLAAAASSKQLGSIVTLVGSVL